MESKTQNAPLGDVAPLLERLGRAATPPVPANVQNLSLRRLLADGKSPEPAERSGGNVSGILSSELVELLKDCHRLTTAIPGDSHQNLDTGYSGIVLIDREAFFAGPWAGAEDFAGRRLGEEAYEYCRQARLSGTPVYYLDSPRPDGGLTERIRSVVDAVLPFPDEMSMEEGAASSQLFSTINDFAARRIG